MSDSRPESLQEMSATRSARTKSFELVYLGYWVVCLRDWVYIDAQRYEYCEGRLLRGG